MKLTLTLFAAVAILACNRQGPQRTTAAYTAADARNPDARLAAPQSYADVVDRVSPAVVTIRSSRRVRAPRQYPFAEDPFFRFFGIPRGGGGESPVQRGLGSGVIVTANGDILTNHHVVDGAEKITVELSDKKTYTAKMVGTDPRSDLALLKIDASNLPVLSLGDSDHVRVGDVCLAVGNPLGIGETVTAGIISAKRRSTGLSDGNFEDFLQTDAPINQGNSGGALVNTTGELIGINAQILSTTGGNIGIGFAIPSNMAKTVLTQLSKGGKVRRGQLGVSIQPVTSEIAAGLGLKEVKGVLVSGVTPGSPADRAGIKPGDVIVAINGQATNDSNDLRNRIASTPPGTEVTLTVVRDGKEMQVKATLGELAESASNQPQGSGVGGGAAQLGISARPLTPDDAAQLGLPRSAAGLLVESVDPAGPAAEVGIRPGDVIVEANRQPVRSVNDLQSAVQKSGAQPTLLLINRGGATIFIAVRPQ